MSAATPRPEVSSQPLLEVERLGVRLGGARVLDGVSFAVGAGEVVGLVGASGSGKSMTALALIGLLPEGAEVEGTLRLDGRDLGALDEEWRRALRGRDIGLVFQEPMSALNPLMSIVAQVAETIRVHRGVSRAQADALARETLARVGLPAGQVAPERYPHELSGGQRQRVAIAIAIALAPRLVIADEPTTALDVTIQARILDLLVRLAREDGAGLILITHDLAVVAERSDRVVVLDAGRVVEQGATAALLAAPAQAYTRRLIADAQVARARAPRDFSGAPVVLEAAGVVRDYLRPRRRPFAPRERLRAVDGVSLALHAGESVGLVGESGCGKSTLLRTLLALDAPQAGAVRVLGAPFAPGPGARALRRRIQVVFQDPAGSFDPRWRVERLVAEPFHLLDGAPTGSARRRRVEEALEQVGLSARDADKYPHEFSGGQRQRIAIARALVTGPEVIALDEAVSALDPSVRAQILALLAELAERRGMAYLFVSHDLAVVRAITDRVLVMRAGRIVEEGPTEAVFGAPRHPYTAQLLAATPRLALGAAGEPDRAGAAAGAASARLP